MPDPSPFPLGERPDYGFAEFDGLMQHLRDSILDVETLAEVFAALQIEGRDLDAEQLAGELHLSRDVGDVVEQLAAFGDQGRWIHSFGSLHIAQITAGSDGMCSVTTFVLATRKGGSIEYWWGDENGGTGALGVRHQARTMAEAIEMIDAVLLAQETSGAASPSAMRTPLMISSMVTRPSSPQSPMQWPKSEVTG